MVHGPRADETSPATVMRYAVLSCALCHLLVAANGARTPLPAQKLPRTHRSSIASERHMAQGPSSEAGARRQVHRRATPSPGARRAMNATTLAAALRGGARALFRRDGGYTGAVAVPARKLVLCTYPKAASTIGAWLALRLAGNLRNAKCVCKPSSCGSGGTRHTLRRAPRLWHPVPFLRSHEALPGREYVRKAWGGVHLLREANFSLIRRALTHPAWTSVAVVRDPWKRAVSAYKDQIGRGHVAYSPRSRDHFLAYTRKREGWGHHTGAAASYCGLHALRYDHVIDLNQGWEAGWRAVLSRHPNLRPFLDDGWQECTSDGSRSLITSRGTTGHEDVVAMAGRGKDGPPGKAQTAVETSIANDVLLCNETTAAAVAERYAEDYDVLLSHGMAYDRPHKCRQGARGSPP